MNRILIIEDEDSIAELEKDYLEISGFEVEICGDGEEGLRKALEEDYNLMILDIMLPGKDGFEICRQVREHKDTPVIFVSARKDDIDKIRGLGLGADDYITKPFSPSELVARVKAHLARFDRLTNKNESEIIEVRGLKIDKTRHSVSVDDVEKNLTAKEFEILSFLATHPGRVYSREELYREIWNLEPVNDDLATVTVHIKKIREKLDDVSSDPEYIETIWGVGYRFK